MSETNAMMSRSISLGSAHSQARAQTVNSLRRTNSNTSEASGNGGGGFSSGSHSTNSAGVSVTASNDPDVLKVEIHRLQAALMNEFKGGNRFIGGAQFKASNNSRGGHGGAGGNSCGGCLQVCAHVAVSLVSWTTFLRILSAHLSTKQPLEQEQVPFPGHDQNLPVTCIVKLPLPCICHPPPCPLGKTSL